MKTSELMKLLPTLSEEQLRTMVAWAKRYKVKATADDDDAELVLKCINTALGLDIPMLGVRPEWRNNAPILIGFLENTFPKHNKLLRYGLCRLMIGLLIDDLRDKGLHCSFGSVWINLTEPRLAEVFDAQFPDYRKSGLTGLILKAMGGTGDKPKG